jgi:hypothetical protein
MNESCFKCNAQLQGHRIFCAECGAKQPENTAPGNFTRTQYATAQPLQQNFVPADGTPHAAAHSLGRMLLLHPAPAFFAIILDGMVTAVDVTTLGITAPFLWLIGGIVTAVVTFMAQKKWADDDQEEAFIKALMVGFLVALPTPFPAFLTVPSAIAGTVQMLRRRS